MAFKSALQLRSPPRHDVLAVDHLAGLLEGTGTLAQILDEISQPVWIPTATGIAKIDDQLPPSLDRSDLEGRLLLTVALQSRRPDALQCFCLLLWKGADPQARGRDDGRMVEWEFEEGHETFKRELNRAIEARRSAPPGRYRMPPWVNQEVKDVWRISELLLKEEREAYAAMQVDQEPATGASQPPRPPSRPPPATSRLPPSAEASAAAFQSMNPAANPPSRLAPSKNVPTPPQTKRPRLSDPNELVDYTEESEDELEILDDVKPDISRLLATSTAPHPVPPAKTPTTVRLTRLPPWISDSVLNHWLRHGPTTFVDVTALAQLEKLLRDGYFQKVPRQPPPKASSAVISWDGVNVSEGEYPTAKVVYASWKEAWDAKTLFFDGERVAPKSRVDPCIVFTVEKFDA